MLYRVVRANLSSPPADGFWLRPDLFAVPERSGPTQPAGEGSQFEELEVLDKKGGGSDWPLVVSRLWLVPGHYLHPGPLGAQAVLAEVTHNDKPHSLVMAPKRPEVDPVRLGVSYFLGRAIRDARPIRRYLHEALNDGMTARRRYSIASRNARRGNLR